MAENQEFDEEEIRLLMEGLDAIGKASEGKLFSATLMGVMLARNKEQAEDLIREAEHHGEIEKAKQELLNERIILVKAKLIKMKDKALARALEEGAE